MFSVTESTNNSGSPVQSNDFAIKRYKILLISSESFEPIVKEFKKSVTLQEIKENPKLQNMKLVKKGTRLSVMPVEKAEFDEIVKMGNK